jgi:hypothetical protein
MDEPLQSKNYEPISQKLLDTALKKIHRAVQGNGVELDKVKIKSYDGSVHVFKTKTLLQLKPTIAKRTEPGRNALAAPLHNELEVNAKAAARIHNAVINAGLRDNIIQAYTKTDKTHGFIAKATKLSLDTLKQDYVLHQDCVSCNSSGKIICQHCNAKGRRNCDLCNGNRQTNCHNCNGQRFIMQNGQRQNCTICNGQGTLNCVTCHGQGIMNCPQCKAQGYIACTKCAQTGSFSVIYHLDVAAFSSFECKDTGQLPQDISKYLKNEKARQTFAQEAKITPLKVTNDDFTKQDTAESHITQVAQETNEPRHQQSIITIPFEIKCPYMDLTISINDQEYTGKALGFRPLFMNFEPFIEILAKKGIESLKSAANSRNDVEEHLKNATEYAIIKELLSLSVRNTNSNTLRQIKRIYPVGVRDSELKSMIMNMRRALKNITFIPRLVGMGLGVGIALLLYFLYMHFDGNSIVPDAFRTKEPMLAQIATTILQLTPLAVTFVLAAALTKMRIRQSLQSIVASADLTSAKANLGQIGLFIPLIYITGAALICEFAVKTENLPLWFTMLRQHLPF